MSQHLLLESDFPKKKQYRCFPGLAALYFIYGFSSAVLITYFINKMFTGSVHTSVGHKVLSWPDPPPHAEVAKVARYVMHISDWGSLSTISTHKEIMGYPFVNIFSVSDGPVDNSTGIPYFYFTELGLSISDFTIDDRVSFTITEDQSDYCKRKGFDPEDPRCAHVIFTGRMVRLIKGSEEESFAKYSLFSRHAEMPDWPQNHRWFFAKLEIIHIYILDFFGAAKVVDVETYFNSNPFEKI